jgi:hypothetical protein
MNIPRYSEQEIDKKVDKVSLYIVKSGSSYIFNGAEKYKNSNNLSEKSVSKTKKKSWKN